MITFVFTHPAEHPLSCEGIDMALVSVNLDIPTRLLFVGAAAEILYWADQNRSPYKKMKLLQDVFDFEEIYLIGTETAKFQHLQVQHLSQKDFNCCTQDHPTTTHALPASKHLLWF